MLTKNDILEKIKKLIENEKFKTRLRFVALFFLGFLLGVMFKSQSLKTVVIGYDDHKIFQNKEVIKSDN